MKSRHLAWIGVFYTLFLGSWGELHAGNDEDPLVVQLSTESLLEPLYLLPMTSVQSDFNQGYIHQLENILAFDLDHNGSSFILKRNSDCDQLGQSGVFEKIGAVEAWRGFHLAYVIKPQVQGGSLIALMLDVQKKSLKSTEPIALTGDFAQDRRLIHRLADTIHRSLFGTEGIASTHILYTVTQKKSSDSTKWISEVWEADYDGANAHQLTQDRSFCVTPIYLPPKPGFTTGGFLYVSYQSGQPKIFIASLKGGKKQRVVSLKGNQLMPAVSLQRDKIAFICDVTGNPDLFIQPFTPEGGEEGKPHQIFSAKQATQGSPTISPDGTRVAFVSNKDGSPKIYLINIPAPGISLNAIKATLLTKCNRENSAPAWSPDGSKIAYCARNKGDRQIWIYDFETRQEKQITEGPGNKENPSWAPNSLHLVYNSSDDNKGELFLINLNDPDPVQVTSGPGEKRFPSWEPRLVNSMPTRFEP